MSRYIAGLEDLLAYIGFHSYGQYLLVPLSDSASHVDNYDDLVSGGRREREKRTQIANGSVLTGWLSPSTRVDHVSHDINSQRMMIWPVTV